MQELQDRLASAISRQRGLKNSCGGIHRQRPLSGMPALPTLKMQAWETVVRILQQHAEKIAVFGRMSVCNSTAFFQEL